MAVDDAYTVSLLHMDGADASTTIIDESGKAWTSLSSNAELDTAQFKFGTASLNTTTSSDYIYTADNADFYFGSDDFTVEAFVKLSAGSSGVQKYVYHHGGLASGLGSDASVWLRLNSDEYPSVVVGHGGGSVVIAHTTTLTDTSNWHHLAAIKYGGNLYVSLDGILSSEAAVTGPIIDTAENVLIGSRGITGSGWPGWIDEVRVSKGVARYTANFSPPGAPFAPPSGENLYFADGFSVY